jgi:hypothetical protein
LQCRQVGETRQNVGNVRKLEKSRSAPGAAPEHLVAAERRQQRLVRGGVHQRRPARVERGAERPERAPRAAVTARVAHERPALVADVPGALLAGGALCALPRARPAPCRTGAARSAVAGAAVFTEP